MPYYAINIVVPNGFSVNAKYVRQRYQSEQKVQKKIIIQMNAFKLYVAVCSVHPAHAMHGSIDIRVDS